MLKKKQSTSDGDWRNAIDNIESVVSKKSIDSLIECTVNDIRDKTYCKNVAYSWSGGKDSIVLAYVCRKAGINKSVFVHCNLEYNSFMEWVRNNAPSGCEFINTKQDIAWLSKHPEMLFPQDSQTAAKWFKIVQHTGQEIYYRRNHLDMIMLGRRRADGNYCGRGNNVYTNARGITRFSPLADWTHEDVLACIHYYKLALPPIYEWKNGYLCGTHNWAERQWTGNVQNGWQEVFDIDPEIVYDASRYFESAGEFLRCRDRKKT